MQPKRLAARLFAMLACLSLLLSAAPPALAAVPAQEPAPVAPAAVDGPNLLSSISGKVMLGGAPLSGVKVTATMVGDPPSNKPKVILLPGVMGSLLEAKFNSSCLTRPSGVAWLDIARTGIDKFTILQPELFDTLVLNDGGALPANACDQISPKGLADTYGLLGLADFYKGAIQSMENAGYEVKPFPYDWRLTIDDTVGKLDQFIGTPAPDAKVILVGHSMGGLVARAYVADATRAAKVNKVITVATPYLGAPKLAYAMMAGKIDFPKKYLEHLLGPWTGKIKEIIRNAPGALQLLPSRTYIGKFPYYTAGGELKTTYEATNNFFVSQGKNQLLLGAADSFHQRLDSFNPSTNYPFTGEYWVLASRNYETILNVSQEFCINSRTLTCYNFKRYILGDGTVPQASALLLADPTLVGTAKTCIYPAGSDIADHSAIMSDPTVQSDIRNILSGVDPAGCVMNGLAQGAAVEEAPSMRQVTVWGEADVRVEDGNGHFAGIDASGLYTSTLPGVSIDYPPNSTVVLLPTSVGYRLTARSLSGMEPAVTVVDFAAPSVDAALTAQGQTLFTNIPVAQGGEIALPNAGAPLADLRVQVDANADGTPEQTLPPDAVLTNPTQAQDVTPPASTITLAGDKDAQGRFTGSATVTVAAQDNAGGSGLLASYTSLDGGATWQKYTAPVQVPQAAATAVQVYSTDKAGNQEYPPKQQALTFADPPNKLFLPAIAGPQARAATAAVALEAAPASPAALVQGPQPAPTAPAPDAATPDAPIQAAALVYTALAQADGTYAIPTVLAGIYDVTAARSGYTITPATQRVVIAVGGGAPNTNFAATAIGPLPGDMKLIPAGNFQMGCAPGDTQCSSNENPSHTVNLSAYAIDTYEVTNARYAACVAAGQCTAPGSTQAYSYSRGSYEYYGVAQYANFPVIYVDWSQANAFCAWDNKRLPTEAEWEKAARGGSDTRIYPWGNATPDCTLGNFYNETTGNYCVGETTAVGTYPTGASPYGVMDMSGNVLEWTNDWWQSDYYATSPANNPQGPATGSSRVLRGGSFNGGSRYVRASYRGNGDPDWYDFFGFRCVRSQ